MPSRTEATRAKAALCATGRLTALRLFSTLPVCSPPVRSGVLQRESFEHNRDATAVTLPLGPKSYPLILREPVR